MKFSITICSTVIFAFFLLSCDDVRIEKYPNGALRYKTPYVNDLKEGLEQEFYESSAIKRKSPYVAGKREGVTKEYYEDGTLLAEYPYVNGYIEGTVSRYYKNGRLSQKALYSKNKQIEFGEYYDESGEPSTSGSYKDSRDSHAYEWIRIGSDIWTAENMNFATVTGSVCMQCNNWGRLYDLNSAKIACPSGFHVPTKEKWQKLIDFAGVKPGFKLKAGFGWDPLKGTANYGNGSDEFGFSAKAGGAHFERSDVSTEKRIFKDAGKKAYFWTLEGQVAVFHYNKDNVTFESFRPEFGASLRCVKD